VRQHSSDNPDSQYATINLQTAREDQHSYDVVQFGQRQEYGDASAYVALNTTTLGEQTQYEVLQPDDSRAQRDSAEYEDAM